MGAWIEIYIKNDVLVVKEGVVPLVGAWIEIENGMRHGQKCISSFPSWERGLKSNEGYMYASTR